MSQPSALLTPGEVAREFGVQAETVSNWARQGRIAAIKTLGGHNRFRRADVERLLDPGREATE